MAKIFAAIRLIAGVLALAFVVATAMPAAAQQPNSVNPTAAAVKEQQLLQQLNKIEGRGSIPDVKSYVLEHPAGRAWREYHSVTLKWIGGIAIFGILAVLTAYYSWHGTMRIEEGRSGRTMLRFNAFERFVHWLTAVVLRRSGDHRPQHQLRPQPDLAVAGPIGVQHMVGMGEVRAQLSQLRLHRRPRVDVPDVGGAQSAQPQRRRLVHERRRHVWRQGAARREVQRRRKADLLDLNFRRHRRHRERLCAAVPILRDHRRQYGTGRDRAQRRRDALSSLPCSSHFYMGTIGVEGAFEAMAEGTVDVNWAKERHSLWYEEEMQSGAVPRGRAAQQPAE